jgi:PhnB protein
MRAIPYLNFDGTCREAFEFYAELLRGELEIVTHGESPMAGEVPAEMRDAILNVYLKAGDFELMASDVPPESHRGMSGVYVSLHLDDVGEAKRIWDGLMSGGDVRMPLEQTFWAERFGMGVDRFGTPWMINCNVPA